MKEGWKKLKNIGFAILVTCSMLPFAGNKAEAANIQNPVVAPDASMKAGQRATWDCIWFGSYPQTEVKAGDSEYAALKSAMNWDMKNDTVINGIKYRRMRKKDAEDSSNSGKKGYYNWPDSTTYHYFRYEPIKWRVLESGGKMFLLSDQTLDVKKNTNSSNWSNCKTRTFLNDMNEQTEGFLGSAFSSEEQSAILTTGLENQLHVRDTVNNIDTQDQVFILSLNEVGYDEETAVCYGFGKEESEDEARYCQATDYAKARGAYSSSSGTTNWELRTFDKLFNYSDQYIYYVTYEGYASASTRTLVKNALGVRPALNLDASKTSVYSYAGTVCSNGTVNEQKPQVPPSGNTGNGGNDTPSGDSNGGNGAPSGTVTDGNNPSSGDVTGGGSTPPSGNTGNNGSASTPPSSGSSKPSKSSQVLTYPKSVTKTYGSKPFTLSVKRKSGNGSLSYKSSNSRIATVNKKGRVTIKGTGICTITAKAAATTRYNSKTVKITLKVKPRKAALKSLSVPGGKKLKVTWKKDTKATGYQIQYSTSRKFTKKTTKTATISKNRTTSKVLTKLKNKKYYVRVRAYKKVTFGGKKQTLYGSWSKTKVSKQVK